MPSKSKSKVPAAHTIRVATPIYRALLERQERLQKARGGPFVSLGAVVADLLAQTAPKGRGRAG